MHLNSGFWLVRAWWGINYSISRGKAWNVKLSDIFGTQELVGPVSAPCLAIGLHRLHISTRLSSSFHEAVVLCCVVFFSSLTFGASFSVRDFRLHVQFSEMRHHVCYRSPLFTSTFWPLLLILMLKKKRLKWVTCVNLLSVNVRSNVRASQTFLFWSAEMLQPSNSLFQVLVVGYCYINKGYIPKGGYLKHATLQVGKYISILSKSVLEPVKIGSLEPHLCCHYEPLGFTTPEDLRRQRAQITRQRQVATSVSVVLYYTSKWMDRIIVRKKKTIGKRSRCPRSQL